MDTVLKSTPRLEDFGRAIREAGPVAFAVFDRDMRYLDASARWRQDYRLGDVDLGGLCHYDVFPEISERWRAVHQRGLAGVSERCEADPFLRADGTVQWVSWEVRPWHDKDGEIGGIVIVSEDISERVQAERALSESESRYRTLIEEAPEAILVYDLRSATLVDANKAAETLFECDRSVLLRDGLSPFYHPQQLDGVPLEESFAEHNAAIIAGQSISFERRFVSAAGTDRVCEVRLSPVPFGDRVMVRGSLIDVTERRRAAEDIRRRKRQYQRTIELAPVGIAHVAPDGRFLMVNETLCRIVGYDDDTLLGRTLLDVTVPEEVDACRANFSLAFEAQGPSGPFERRYLHRDGTAIPCEVSYAVERDDTGAPAYLLTIVSDLTARRRAEEERLRLSAQLFQSQKMEAIGQLTGGIAHDFNNMLGVILGNLEFLRQETLSQAEREELIQAAIQAAERSAELTRHLLAFVRQQPLEPKLVAMSDVLQCTIRLLGRTVGQYIALRIDIARDLWPVMVDVAQLESAVLNVAVNARDAMPKGGTLTIGACNRVVDPTEVPFDPELPPGEYVVIAMTDTGVGMIPEVRARVFEPFYTTKGAKGSGLGLSMVHGFVKQSGGHTRIYSEPGLGTTVSIYLPRVRDVAQPAEPVRDLPPTNGHGELVLIAEDDDALRKLAVRRLEKLGYRTIAAADGPAALAELHKEDAISLLFTDVIMPGMTGGQLAAEARRLRPDLPVLFTSGFADAASFAQTQGERPRHILTKPYRQEELAMSIRAALDGLADPGISPVSGAAGPSAG